MCNVWSLIIQLTGVICRAGAFGCSSRLDRDTLDGHAIRKEGIGHALFVLVPISPETIFVQVGLEIVQADTAIGLSDLMSGASEAMLDKRHMFKLIRLQERGSFRV